MERENIIFFVCAKFVIVKSSSSNNKKNEDFFLLAPVIHLYMKIIIAGKSGSGKDFLKSGLTEGEKMEERLLKPSVACTTRPPREGEEHGQSYYFLSEEDFLCGIEENFFLEWKVFNRWYYGTRNSDWESEANVFIMTPSVIADLEKRNLLDKDSVVIVYLDIDIETRTKRIKERVGSADELERRLKADEDDFRDFCPFFCSLIWILEPYFTVENILDSIRALNLVE